MTHYEDPWWLFRGRIITLLNTDRGLLESSRLDGGRYRSPVADDFNRDGMLDLAAFDGEEISVFVGRGNGSFDSPIRLPEGSFPLAAADFNSDGKPDLLAGGLASPFSTGLRVLINTTQ